MTMSQPLQSVLAVFVGAGLVVLLTELQKRVWSGGYFALHAFLTGFEYQGQPSGIAIIVRGTIPFLAGATTAALAPGDTVLLAALAATAGTLAIAWPVFLSIEVIPPELYGRENQLRFLHLMYVATATVLGFAGGLAWIVLGAVGGDGLVRFGADVIRELTVQALAALLLFVLGVLGLKFQARRSQGIRDQITGAPQSEETPGNGG
jgi:hypothetical protein